ncbi:hypothetical protein [Ruminiclostridium cellobioparum]|uniref:hypothetical protein n=1 Tax=Ruminiclostridium cellobioparum TaxID=29355 RepID=UPI0004898B34|nr:hypothetical protein [Ruminiclostridium cellobioparum]
MEYITFCENGIYMVFSVSGEHCLSLLYFSALPYGNLEFNDFDYRIFNPVELVISEAEYYEEQKTKRINSLIHNYGLCYRYHTDMRNPTGRKIEFVTIDEEKALEITLHFQFYNDISAVRCWSEVYNGGTLSRLLKYVSSLNLHWPRNYKLKSFNKEIDICLLSNYVKNGLGLLVQREHTEGLCFQIGDNSLRHWEFGEYDKTFYLKVGGPDRSSGWQKIIAPDECFISIPVMAAVRPGDLNSAFDELMRVGR